MVFKVSLCITLIVLALFWATAVGWVTLADIKFVYEVGVVASIIAAIALLAGK